MDGAVAEEGLGALSPAGFLGEVGTEPAEGKLIQYALFMPIVYNRLDGRPVAARSAGMPQQPGQHPIRHCRIILL
jgi:hypothetical protein